MVNRTFQHLVRGGQVGQQKYLSLEFAGCEGHRKGTEKYFHCPIFPLRAEDIDFMCVHTNQLQ